VGLRQGDVSMKKQYKQMVDTRRVYQLETDMYYDRRFEFITRQRSLDYLKRYANKIWKGEGYKNPLPLIRFGKGMQKYSWCDGKILELAPFQRDILTLVHELVHAIGYDDHDKKFAAKELILLDKYTPVKLEALHEMFEVMI
jgi:hypothetical protein